MFRLRIGPAAHWVTWVAPLLVLSTDPAQATQDRDTTQTRSAWWKPATWAIGGSVLSRDKDGRTELDFDVDALSEWEGPADRVEMWIRSAYELDGGTVDKNEQFGTTTWFHNITTVLFTMVEAGLERNTVNLPVMSGDTAEFDYLLLRVTGGTGLRRRWSARANTRIAVQWNQVHVRLLEPGVGAWTNAVSVYTSGDFRLAAPIRLSNWSKVYFWQRGDEGFESHSELAFDVLSNLALGFRHRFRHDAATLEAQSENELRFFTRIRF